MTQQTILLTGAFGQVGQRCLQYLLNAGHKVIALDVQTPKTLAAEKKVRAETNNWDNLSVEHLDLLNSDDVELLVSSRSPNVIIHLAAIVSPPCYSNPVLARKINVNGTQTLINAARKLQTAPLFIFASSSAVYGSCNPYTRPEKITPETLVKPIDCYGEDKVMGENMLMASGLPYAILRLGGVISADGMGNMRDEYLVLVRATPRDNRVHAVDARDAALAFANAVNLTENNRNKVYLIGGNDSYLKTQRELEDDVMEVTGIGRLGNSASLPGNPDDELGWSFTDWYDTSEAEAILQFQIHQWHETLDSIGSSINPVAKTILRILGPLIRMLMRTMNAIQRKQEKRGPYADPWKLIAQKYGDRIIAPCDL